MNDTAYLVAHVDCTTDPPRLYRAGIYSSPHLTLGPDDINARTVVLKEVVAKDYHDASRKLAWMITDMPPSNWRTWLLKQIKEYWEYND